MLVKALILFYQLMLSSSMKRLICVRHSITECNEALARRPWGTPGFSDPLLWDTVLSERGIALAKDVHQGLRDRKGGTDLADVQLVVTSPLWRALQTSELVFGGGSLLPSSARKMAHPLLRERLYLSSDVGKRRAELEAAFPAWDFGLLPEDGPWWYTENPSQKSKEWRPSGSYACPGEPKAVFDSRVAELREWILAREETTIVLVAHWGLLRGLFGVDAANCEIIERRCGEMLAVPAGDC